jgi:hypothetical protein
MNFDIMSNCLDTWLLSLEVGIISNATAQASSVMNSEILVDFKITCFKQQHKAYDYLSYSGGLVQVRNSGPYFPHY